MRSRNPTSSWFPAAGHLLCVNLPTLSCPDYLRNADRNAEMVTSVCTGSLPCRGWPSQRRPATTHWAYHRFLKPPLRAAAAARADVPVNTHIASYGRANEWASIRSGITRRVRMAVVSSTAAWHQSSRVAATVRSPFIVSERLGAASPLAGHRRPAQRPTTRRAGGLRVDGPRVGRRAAGVRAADPATGP